MYNAPLVAELPTCDQFIVVATIVTKTSVALRMYGRMARLGGVFGSIPLSACATPSWDRGRQMQ